MNESAHRGAIIKKLLRSDRSLEIWKPLGPRDPLSSCLTMQFMNVCTHAMERDLVGGWGGDFIIISGLYI